MIGATLGSYKIVEKIGEGGMGVVYAAVHPLLGRKAAIKVLLPEFSHNAEVVTRFFNEARATAQLKHPGMVDVFDFGHHADGSAYLVMEFLEGESLAALIRGEGKLEEPMVIALARQVATALGVAHAKGIVHRDLKPDNVFLVPDGELACGLRTKILDFGIAKLSSDGNVGVKTRTGAVMGTPLYMSPEQCRGAGPVDHRTDLYSLGCMMYEMACGRPLFERQGLGELIAAQLYEQPPSPRSISPSLSPGLEAIILRLLAKRPEDRPATAEELREELDLAASGGEQPSAAAAPSRTFERTSHAEHPTVLSSTLSSAAAELTRIPVATKRRPFVPAALALLVGAAVLVIALTRHRDPPPAPSASKVTAPLPVAAPPPPPVIVEPSKPPASVRLGITSEPAGAEVYRVADGVKVGVTPLSLELAPVAGSAVYLLKLEGYRDARAELAADRDGAQVVRLQRAGHRAERPAAPRSSTSTPPPPSTHRPIRDGVADPFSQ